eukprot:1799386-Pleurochrysis_carterae.AAC.1
MAKSLKPRLSPPALPAPALTRSCSSQEGDSVGASAVSLLRPARIGDRKLCGPYQKVRAPSFFLQIRREVFLGGRGRRHRPLPYQKVQLLSVSSRSCPLGCVVVFDPVSDARAWDMNGLIIRP